jgi:hypothetical protein
MAADFGERFTARDEFALYRQEEGLAEPANWRLRFEIERVTDDVAVEFVHDDPEMAICIEAGATFFDCRDLEGEPLPLGLFRGDRENRTRSPSARAIRTPTAMGRSLRPSVSPFPASRCQR